MATVGGEVVVEGEVDVGVVVVGEGLGDDGQRRRVGAEVVAEGADEEGFLRGLLVGVHLVEEALEGGAEVLGIDRHEGSPVGRSWSRDSTV
jgi:hypothetical protein